MKHVRVLLGLLIPFCMGVHAQDTHYWTNQFGTRAALLSGAVLGGIEDNTMVYYNPGALGFMENASVSINANAYSVENVKVENALGKEADFKSLKVVSVPLLAGGMIPLKNDRWKIGYAFVSPVDFNFKGIARVEGRYDLLDESESPGAEETVAEAGLTTRTSEVQFLLGGGHRINDHWSVGLSNVFTVRSHSFERSLTTYIFQNTAGRELVGGSLLQNVDYYNVRYALKMGVVYRNGSWSTGLTMTSPSLNLFGVGTVASNITAQNLNLGGGDRVSGVATARQADLKTRYKSPFNVAWGLNYESARSYVGLAIQYYAALDPYQIVEPEPGAFVRPADLLPQLQSDQFLNLRAAAESVFNVALGYEYQLKEKISLLASVRSNSTYFDNTLNEGTGIKNNVSNWDIFHFTLGTTLNNENSSLSIGLMYSTGNNDKYIQNGTFDPDSLNLLEGSATITRAGYNNFGLLLGYTYYLRRFRLKETLD